MLTAREASRRSGRTLRMLLLLGILAVCAILSPGVAAAASPQDSVTAAASKGIPEGTLG
jgi:hypothetical protein